MSDYTNREIDMKFDSVAHSIKDMAERHEEKLDLILEQTTKTNGRVSKHDDQINKLHRILLIVGVATGTLLVTNGSQLVKFIMSII